MSQYSGISERERGIVSVILQCSRHLVETLVELIANGGRHRHLGKILQPDSGLEPLGHAGPVLLLAGKVRALGVLLVGAVVPHLTTTLRAGGNTHCGALRRGVVYF